MASEGDVRSINLNCPIMILRIPKLDLTARVLRHDKLRLAAIDVRFLARAGCRILGQCGFNVIRLKMESRFRCKAIGRKIVENAENEVPKKKLFDRYWLKLQNATR